MICPRGKKDACAFEKNVSKIDEGSVIFSARDLTLCRRERTVLRNLNIQVEKGSLVAVVGENGIGKTTLLQALIEPSGIQCQGELTWHQVARDEIAYLPQRTEAQRGFPLRVRDVVAGGLWRKLGPFRSLRSDDRALIARALADVEMQGMEAVCISTLSGGQFQRMLFARLLLQKARVFLLDEPFTGLDEATRDLCLAHIAAWRRAGHTQLVVLHDCNLVREHFPLTILLDRDGASIGPTDEILCRRKNF